MALGHITIKTETTPELKALLDKALQLGNESAEFSDLLFNRFDSGSELIRVNDNGLSTPRAGEFWIVLEPSDAFREFMAAFA